ncbi:DNA-3-methyladenine glycosylase I [Agaribacter flavus]|uniref:DNA-3-methyladenine glycosylase I n=1 Tax=Agaribacter flavus TaxID=1902781 RepID=A0ABV7FLG8_9ALTE
MDQINENLFIGNDGKARCNWCSATEGYIDYHDKEWGFPVSDDRTLFEKLCLESFQSGLSWRTILTKREGFRRAFDNFDFNKVAKYNESKINELLQDEGIVRHRGKIEAVINNAKQAILMVDEFGSLATYLWRYRDDTPEPTTRATSDLSIALSKDLKKRGWKFVGPTTAYAFMQAMGLVNDHSEGCYVRKLVEQARRNFVQP